MRMGELKRDPSVVGSDQYLTAVVSHWPRVTVICVADGLAVSFTASWPMCSHVSTVKSVESVTLQSFDASTSVLFR